MTNWISNLQKAVLDSLNSNTSDKSKQGLVGGGKSPLELVREIPANCTCADCGAPGMSGDVCNDI